VDTTTSTVTARWAPNLSHFGVAKAVQAQHRERTIALVADLENLGTTVTREANADAFTINSELRVRFVPLRCRRTRTGHRWFFRFKTQSD